MNDKSAPGGSGFPPRWTAGSKTGVGTAVAPASKVWFTIGEGIVNEIYHPRIDKAAVRDLGFVITDGRGFFSEEKLHTTQSQSYPHPGVPLYHLVNKCREGRYKLEKTLISDPSRHVFLQRARFTPLEGNHADYNVVLLLAPRLGNRGHDNQAWLGDYKGAPMIFAEAGGVALAMACNPPWALRSVGHIGTSDAWQDLEANGSITQPYDRVGEGNVGLAGQVATESNNGEFTVAIGFGRTAQEAGHRAQTSLNIGFDKLAAQYTEEWQTWSEDFSPPPSELDSEVYTTSRFVLKTHEAKNFHGGYIASLAIPWGSTRGDDEPAGYHVIWPRDLVLSAGALLAAGAKDQIRPVLEFLRTTQEPDGRWPQNMWVDGTPHWNGTQLDEIALPILLVDHASREGALSPSEQEALWPMIRKAAGFLVRHGPVTEQDRWEENAGYSPFTLATEIAALLAAADAAETHDPGLASYLRDKADEWNASIEEWTYVEGTELADEVGVDGYYVRIAPVAESGNGAAPQGLLSIANRPSGTPAEEAWRIVSPDALALVRFGLRHPHDPRILNTVKVIDSLVAVETPVGTGYRRYNGDGYGEHEDGSDYNGTGIGRLWPLLTAERAHYELAAGNIERARELATTVASFANRGHLLPEQVWDVEVLPEKGFEPGRGTGSATPLVWAHGEYMKLVRSLANGEVFDLPPQPVERYTHGASERRHVTWKPQMPAEVIPAGVLLRVELGEPATVRCSTNGRDHWNSFSSAETGLGTHIVDLPTSELDSGQTVRFRIETGDGNHPADGYTVAIGGRR